MPRRANPWWQHTPTIKLRLRAFNAQGARYRQRPILLSDLEAALKKASPVLLSLCCYCGRKLEKRGPSGVSFDHTKPLVRGGLSILENLSFCCRTCNFMKGSWTADFYIKFVGFMQENGMWADFCRAFRRKW